MLNHCNVMLWSSHVTGLHYTHNHPESETELLGWVTFPNLIVPEWSSLSIFCLTLCEAIQCFCFNLTGSPVRL
ncbi:MAG: hypothetical protein EWM72_01778 [Nitrospira sp.]|nr:MAG: hypothetical protein EWM72_01778 [Nitrospira sp.]